MKRSLGNRRGEHFILVNKNPNRRICELHLARKKYIYTKED